MIIRACPKEAVIIVSLDIVAVKQTALKVIQNKTDSHFTIVNLAIFSWFICSLNKNIHVKILQDNLSLTFSLKTKQSFISK